MGILEFLKNKKFQKELAFEEEKMRMIMEQEATADKIRMVYVAIEKYKSYSDKQEKLGITHNTSSPFFIPEGMSIEDAYKVVSYISEKVEREYNKVPASNNSVAYTTYTLEHYGFKKADKYPKQYSHRTEYNTGKGTNIYQYPTPNTMNLYTVGGDFKEFKKSNLYKEYFEWFTPKIDEKEIQEIYAKIGMEIPNFDPDEPII